MNKKEQQLKELTHLLLVTQQLMSTHLKVSKRTIRLFFYISMINAKIASAMLEAEFGVKKSKRSIWIAEIQQKFQLMEQVFHKLEKS